MRGKKWELNNESNTEYETKQNEMLQGQGEKIETRSTANTATIWETQRCAEKKKGGEYQACPNPTQKKRSKKEVMRLFDISSRKHNAWCVCAPFVHQLTNKKN